MTATAHALVAGAIAAKFPDPVTAAAISFSSHFIMDSIPHWDVGTNWRMRPKTITGIFAIAETIGGMCLSFFLFGGHAPTLTLIVAIVASILPDWLETPWYVLFAHQKKHEPAPRAGIWERFCYHIYKLENTFHTKAQLPLGLATQVVTVAFFLVVLSS
ncbi:hypothetical protein A2973_05490 [Candidatus Gottesmanbacteria bacterium RIFCSPLOWO2_01_FULL_49_10]|uniref:Uncharacterized protein n=1 Tax=Candidatus Gottesmanbacteria bacterium RIFCSPLOWO2_01_FULL_49_10 TaxID=1798396 RepID=A0A1F6B133_9BACT|nr:MAG: hypothetical protein UY10_C0001G0012 [Microgenomates group bacterium GW2011_GWA2_47_8]OGG30629.1 MAG: hypothetical protein A2973_05490 [Candidatus Gottesmanbacteria bacterium RIFCSPLOWO2_01_FULL_49_10]